MSDTTETAEQVSHYGVKGFRERDISRVVCDFFGVKVSVNSDDTIAAHYYPYSNGGYKKRSLPKTFTWVGTPNGLFGKDKFTPGGKRLVITEGEIDALSVAQASYDQYDKTIYPVVSIPSAAYGAKELLENREWIRSFGEVVLFLDNDEPGKKATEEAKRIIGIDKVKIVHLVEFKDANEVLLKKASQGVMRAIWDAQAWVPSGIIGKEEIWKQIIERNSIESLPYPPCLAGVNSKLKGMRRGEITLLISGTGSGKSTIIRETILHVIETTEDKVGIISLEESPGETGIKLASMAIRKNPAAELISDDELKVGFDSVFGHDQIILLDHQGSVKDSSIVDKLEYMCLMGAKYLFIDHITILVSEGDGKLEGNAAIDKVMNDLLRLVKRHDVWVGLVSHLRKVPGGHESFESGVLPAMDDIRGSGSIKQVSFDIIAFARNMTHDDERVRNTILMSILKSRTMGQTGPVKGAVYDNETGRLTAAEVEFFTKEDEQKQITNIG